MAINIDRHRLLIEGLKDYGQNMIDAMGQSRCPMCGCDTGVGQVILGYGDYPFVQYCLAECGYEEYV